MILQDSIKLKKKSTNNKYCKYKTNCKTVFNIRKTKEFKELRYRHGCNYW